MTNNTRSDASRSKHEKFKKAMNMSEAFKQYCFDYDVIPTRRQQSKFRTRGQRRMQVRRHK